MDPIRSIRSDLFALQDPSYRAFHARLIPEVPPETIIGVRIPLIRSYAKKVSGSEEATAFLRSLPHSYYDENNLHMALIERMKDPLTAYAELERFLPYLDNWATCDSFFPKVLLQDPSRLLSEIRIWVASDRPFTVRYGLVRLLAFPLPMRFSVPFLDLAASVRSEEYYVRMAQAWFFSMALVQEDTIALSYLQNRSFDAWVQNKAIQKALESRRCTAERKAELLPYRIFGTNPKKEGNF